MRFDWSCQVSGSRSKQFEVMEVSRPFLVSLGMRPEHAKTTQDLPSAIVLEVPKGRDSPGREILVVQSLVCSCSMGVLIGIKIWTAFKL